MSGAFKLPKKQKKGVRVDACSEQSRRKQIFRKITDDNCCPVRVSAGSCNTWMGEG